MRHEAEVLLEAMLSSHTTKANEDHVPQPGREFSTLEKPLSPTAPRTEGPYCFAAMGSATDTPALECFCIASRPLPSFSQFRKVTFSLSSS